MFKIRCMCGHVGDAGKAYWHSQKCEVFQAFKNRDKSAPKRK